MTKTFIATTLLYLCTVILILQVYWYYAHP
jgi:hypothetical protein